MIRNGTARAVTLIVTDYTRALLKHRSPLAFFRRQGGLSSTRKSAIAFVRFLAMFFLNQVPVMEPRRSLMAHAIMLLHVYTELGPREGVWVQVGLSER